MGIIVDITCSDRMEARRLAAALAEHGINVATFEDGHGAFHVADEVRQAIFYGEAGEKLKLDFDPQNAGPIEVTDKYVGPVRSRCRHCGGPEAAHVFDYASDDLLKCACAMPDATPCGCPGFET